MIFDVMVRAGKNAVGKDVYNVYRVHDSMLSEYLRNVQDVGHYIMSVIPLFRQKKQNELSKVEIVEMRPEDFDSTDFVENYR